MASFVPVLGFHIGEEYSLGNLTLSPLPLVRDDVRAAAEDRQALRPTALLHGPGLTKEAVFHLPAILTVIEQRICDVSLPAVEAPDLAGAAALFQGQAIVARRPGHGHLVMRDGFGLSSRQEVIARALARVIPEGDSDVEVAFRQLLHKAAMACDPDCAGYVDVEYFLLFSGLETMACARTGSKGGAQAAIARYLSDLGFDVTMRDDDDLERGMLTYAKLRNALFHNGKFVADYGPGRRIELTAYLRQFRALVALAILRELSFDDGRTNWTSWRDRMPFTQKTARPGTRPA